MPWISCPVCNVVDIMKVIFFHISIPVYYFPQIFRSELKAYLCNGNHTNLYIIVIIALFIIFLHVIIILLTDKFKKKHWLEKNSDT